MDFTLQIYKRLLEALQSSGYQFQTFEAFLQNPAEGKVIVLRHDVDLKAENSLATAIIENSLGIHATYFFRVVPQSDKPRIIKQIASLGHEIGYHYEDMAICGGDTEKAIEHFKDKLQYFRQFYPVKTICMHGAPRSRFDGKDLWKKYDYRDYCIIGEPYFDVDFNHVFYLTDTGRCWDGSKFSVRDKVQTTFTQSYHSTNQIIAAAQDASMPTRIMITTHPQRWTDSKPQWFKELLLQNIKNIAKRILLLVRK